MLILYHDVYEEYVRTENKLFTWSHSNGTWYFFRVIQPPRGLWKSLMATLNLKMGYRKKIWNDLFLKASVDIYENWVCWNKWLHCGIMGKKKQVKLDHTFFLRAEWCVGPAHQHLPWTTGIRPVHRLPYLSPRWKRDSNRELVFLGPWSRVGQRWVKQVWRPPV